MEKKLFIKMYIKDVKLINQELNWVLPATGQLTLWSQLNNILIRYKGNEDIQYENEQVNYYLEEAHKNMDLAIKYNNDNNRKNNLELISDQIKLLYSSHRFSCFTIIFSFLIFSHSHNIYELLRNHLILPTKRHLQQISSRLNISPDSDAKNIHYLSHIAKNLKDEEKIVALLLDEIYIDPHLQYKSNKITGFAENGDKGIARTVQSFMIKSVFGNFKEICKLCPVKSLKGDELYVMTKQVIKLVQSIGFKVIVIITDNNRVNQNLYKLFTDGKSFFFPNPDYIDFPIYLMYDPVHIFKNFRNNWLNLKNLFLTFLFPDMNMNSDNLKKASFSHIRDQYQKEKHLLLKKAYKLNYKSVHPSSMERQSVTLVDNIFHDSTIAAIKEVDEYKETADFLQIINNWWNIFNVKNCTKGIHKRNEWAHPFYDVNDKRLLFLNNFLDWLKKWNEMKNNNGILTVDTYKSAFQTTSVMIELIKFSLITLKKKFVLPGKFQTDDLEGRFRLYRSLAGCNYKVSLTEVLECEKKIRIYNIFSHNIKDYEELNDDNIDYFDCENLCLDFHSIFSTEYLSNAKIEPSAIVYTSGYAAHSISSQINCVNCKNIIVKDKGNDIDDTYFDHLQRGGLSVAEDEVRICFYHMNAILDEILKEDELKKKFFTLGCHKIVLIALTLKSLENNNVSFNYITDCECGLNSVKLFKKLCSPMANILIKNYTNNENNNLLEIKNQKSKEANQKRINKSINRKIQNFKN